MLKLTRMFHVRAFTQAITVVLLGLISSGALAQKRYDPGASDSEIRLGNIAPYSGPVSALAVIAKTEAAYFKMINAEGGINGRKINFISYDDGYSPPKTIEQARKLVERDEVLALVSVVGTPGNSAIQKYANSKNVPQFFIVSGATRFADPKAYPWSMGWGASYPIEARIYARYIQDNYPGKKIGILYQNDDFGMGYIAGVHEVLGSDAGKLIVSERSYEVTDPTVQSQISQIRSTNPDIFLNFATAKFAAQAIRVAAELGWRPVQFLSSSSASIGSVLKPAGLANAQEILTAISFRDPGDPQWSDDPGAMKWRAFMNTWFPEGDQKDGLTLAGYGVAEGIVQVLKQCGDTLTRENMLRQMRSLNMTSAVYIPGIRITTSPTDYNPIKQLQLARFKGESWVRFGDIIDGSATEK